MRYFFIRSLACIVSINQSCIKVFLAQALGMGLSQALLFLPSLSILGQHFRQRRALAIGIATSVIDSVPPPVLQICYNFPGRLNGRNNLAYYAESTQPGHLVCKLDTSNSSADSLTLDCRKPCCQIQTSSNKRCCKTKCPKHIWGFSLYGIDCLVSIEFCLLGKEMYWFSM